MSVASNQALSKAVSDAVEKETNSGAQENVGEVSGQETGAREPEVEVKEEEKPQQENKKQAAQPEEDERTRDAKQLYSALENPESSKRVIEELARRVGLEIAKPREVPQATKSILERMKERVAPEYHFLVDNLAPGIESLVKETLNEELKPVRMTMAQQQEAAAKREVEASYEKMKAKHKDFAELEPKMNEIAARIKLAPGGSLDAYLEDLYTLASKDRVETQAVNRAVNRINRNAQEVRPASAEVSDTAKNGSRLPTLNEAIAAAVRGERLG